MNKIMLKFELCLQTKLYQEEFKNINKDNICDIWLNKGLFPNMFRGYIFTIRLQHSPTIL